MELTSGQKQRINELDIFGEYEQEKDREFTSQQQRDDFFDRVENELVKKNKARLKDLTRNKFTGELRQLENNMQEVLQGINFTEVVTPIKLARGHLENMGIDEEHPLWQQVYWLEGKNHCLRPMHAPHLYSILGRFEKMLTKPVSIFEVGPCFRKESSGREHISEFTMLNLVELGPEQEPASRLQEIVKEIMGNLEIEYELCREESNVYGETFDVLVNDMEVGSGAVGPHELDEAWEISDSWAGIGFGLERLIMARDEMQNITRVGRSLIYQDGARLNV